MEFTSDQLRAQFNRVCDPIDWKAPICAFIRPDEKEITRKAIEFMTGTEAIFTPDSSYFVDYLRVESIGYRNGPAGDH